MTKVILDFQNLKEGPENSGYLQRMTEMAKEARGFCFYIDKGDSTASMLVSHLNIMSLAALVRELEDSYPEIRELNTMAKLLGLNGGE